jgi:hypothetical protein
MRGGLTDSIEHSVMEYTPPIIANAFPSECALVPVCFRVATAVSFAVAFSDTCRTDRQDLAP